MACGLLLLGLPEVVLVIAELEYGNETLPVKAI